MKSLAKRQDTLPAHVAHDRVVQRLQQAEEALAYAVGIDQVRLVMDVAAAQEVFATRQRMGEAVIGQAHALKTRALVKLGELLEALPKDQGGLRRGTQSVPRETTYAELGVTKKLASVAQQLAALPEATREAIAQREVTLSQARREVKAAEVTRRVSLPDAKYRVLYADPPWSYNDKADAGAVQAGGAERHYPSMSIAELCALPIPALCEPDAVLFLWVTSPLLFESAAVIKAWGFSYKTSIVWWKMAHNMGHYVSAQHEFLLICTRGSCTPDIKELLPSVVTIKRGKHSEKPEAFRAMIDKMYPFGKRLELFARSKADNWDSWGNEMNHISSEDTP